MNRIGVRLRSRCLDFYQCKTAYDEMLPEWAWMWFDVEMKINLNQEGEMFTNIESRFTRLQFRPFLLVYCLVNMKLCLLQFESLGRKS